MLLCGPMLSFQQLFCAQTGTDVSAQRHKKAECEMTSLITSFLTIMLQDVIIVMSSVLLYISTPVSD